MFIVSIIFKENIVEAVSRGFEDVKRKVDEFCVDSGFQLNDYKIMYKGSQDYLDQGMIQINEISKFSLFFFSKIKFFYICLNIFIRI